MFDLGVGQVHAQANLGTQADLGREVAAQPAWTSTHPQRPAWVMFAPKAVGRSAYRRAGAPGLDQHANFCSASSSSPSVIQRHALKASTKGS